MLAPRTHPSEPKEVDVEITIGVQNQARELVLESDQTAAEVTAAVTQALESGSVLDLTDHRGRRVLVPTAAIGYIEIGSEEQRKVGFGPL